LNCHKGSFREAGSAFRLVLYDSKAEKRVATAESMKCGKNFFQILDYGKMMAKRSFKL